MDINQTIQTMYAGKIVTKFNKMGKEYPILLQTALENRRKSENLA